LIPILDHPDESLFEGRAEVRTLKDSFFQILSTKSSTSTIGLKKHIDTCNSDKWLPTGSPGDNTVIVTAKV